jgi:uncharacterized protein YjbJ (UPF0337 family)
MNKDVFEGKWKEIRGKSKEWWSLINDIDLNRVDKSPLKLDKYVVLLQVKYGYTKQHAREEINRRLEAHAAEEGKVPAMKPGKIGVVVPKQKVGTLGLQTQNTRVIQTLKKESTK